MLFLARIVECPKKNSHTIKADSLIGLAFIPGCGYYFKLIQSDRWPD